MFPNREVDPVFLELIASDPAITLNGMAIRLADERAMTAGVGTLWRFFAARAIKLKRKRRTRPSRTGRTCWRPAKPGSKPSPTLIPRGWSSSTRPGYNQDGAPARTMPQGRASPVWNSAWSLENHDLRGRSTFGGFTAPMVLDGPMTGPWFLAYTEQILAPTLRPGDVVILDNLPAHKGQKIRAAMER